MVHNNQLKIQIIPKEFKDLGLYIHIPFCIKKCDYCDFLSAPANEETIKEYFEALKTEIFSYSNHTSDYIVRTIFFGGGTPSSVEEHYITEVMNSLRQIFTIDEERLEATIEVNPGTITKTKLLAYQAAGINRISFGLQTADNKELRMLGRIHTYEQFEANYKLAREVGFHNINVDLMSALPGQTVSSWEKTLNTVIGLKPEHISAYSLIIEEETPFYELYQEGGPKNKELPDEDTDRNIYHRTKEVLEGSGYIRYEISNYAKPGKECRHNSSYWIGTDYLGIGLGASSLLDGARFSNLHNIKQYINLYKTHKMNYFDELIAPAFNKKQAEGEDYPLGIRIDYQTLTPNQRMEEFMFLGLRMCNGISRNAFLQRFGVPIEKVYGEVIEELKNKKLLVANEDYLQLTDYGIDISNSVLSVFLLN